MKVIIWIIVSLLGMLHPTDPLKMFTSTAEGWHPSNGLYYESSNRWADHDFNVWTFNQNAAIVCSVDSPQLAKVLHEQLLEHMEGNYVVHDFPYTFEGLTIEPYWVSGFANGVALTGISALYECYDNPDFLATADRLFQGYVDGEFNYEMPNGSLWFQEYPIEDSRVLNGHIYGVFGLHYYYQATGNYEALPYLLRGAEAVAVYGWDYRRPGQINLYDQYGPDTDDYGPARTIWQMDALCLMTGDDRFKDLRDAFAEDMPDYAAQVTLSC